MYLDVMQSKYGESVSLIPDMNGIDFKMGDLEVQMSLLSILVDSKDVSIEKLIEMINDLEKCVGCLIQENIYLVVTCNQN